MSFAERPRILFDTVSVSSLSTFEGEIRVVLDHVDKYLESLVTGRNAPKNTIIAYRTDLRQFQDFLSDRSGKAGAGEVHWRRVEKVDIDAFIASLKDGFRTSTLQRKTSVVKSFFGYLVGNGVIERDPSVRVDYPVVEGKAAPQILTVAQVETLLTISSKGDTSLDKQYATMLLLLYKTGMSINELLSLNCTDVNLELRTVRCYGRNSRERKVRIDSDLATQLQDHMLGTRPLCLTEGEEQGALFVYRSGKRLVKQTFWNRFSKYVKAAGLPPETKPHTLRHSRAVHLLDDGASWEDVQKLLGHAYLATTQGMYGEFKKMLAAASL